jgi:hypothetical protein
VYAQRRYVSRSDCGEAKFAKIIIKIRKKKTRKRREEFFSLAIILLRENWFRGGHKVNILVISWHVVHWIVFHEIMPCSFLSLEHLNFNAASKAADQYAYSTWAIVVLFDMPIKKFNISYLLQTHILHSLSKDFRQ